MSKSLRAEVTIPVDIGNLKSILIDNGYFIDKDDERRLTLNKLDINDLQRLMAMVQEDYERNDFLDLIGSIEKYGEIDIWLGY